MPRPVGYPAKFSAAAEARAPKNMLYKRFRFNGTGTTSMNTDGSSSHKTFSYDVPASNVAVIERVLFNIVDAAMQITNFGGVASLTTGCKVLALDNDDSELIDFTDGITIKENNHFTYLAGVDTIVEPGAGDDHLPVRWTISKSGAPLSLTSGQKLAVVVQDDVGGLTEFGATVQGSLHSA